MNCQTVQNQILGLPDPRELSPELREHVLACPACREWARQAARLEAILEQLPVPEAPGEKKEAMLGDLMAADPVIQPMAVLAVPPSYGRLALRVLRSNAAYVGGLAAAVLVAVGAYWMWPTGPGPQTARSPNDPFLQKIVAGNTELARADTPAKRIEVLDKLADTVFTETRGMARIAQGAKLYEMAGWYGTYVKDGMLARAKELQSQPAAMSAAEKAKLFDALASKLNANAVEAEKLAGEAPQDAQPALKRMADAARDGEQSLRDVARGSK
jgi:hypothetical protein